VRRALTIIAFIGYRVGPLMNGIILVDKPAGPTSAEVVRAIKPRVRPARVGHLGTLDPLATGVLPILIGEGTKLAPFIQDGHKFYTGLIVLGAETDTLDRAGAVTRTSDRPDPEPLELAACAEQFTGKLEQIPPLFSAIKRAGVPLYKLARGGEVEPPAPRLVEIYRLRLALHAPGAIYFEVECAPGTYVRSLARDIGVALGAAAHLGELRRTRSGNFAIEDARPLNEVLAALEQGTDGGLIGLREALADLPEVEVDESREARLRNGDSRALDFLAPPNAAMFKVVAGGRLIAVAETVSRATARMLRGFN
jgi:tRNA pseudouridine55 synthase